MRRTTATERLERLKVLVEETDRGSISPPCDGCDACPGGQTISTRMFSDAELGVYLQMAGGDVKAAAYHVLLHKAEITNISLSSGITLPDMSAYWLRLASHYRPNRTGTIRRADDPERSRP